MRRFPRALALALPAALITASLAPGPLGSPAAQAAPPDLSGAPERAERASTSGSARLRTPRPRRHAPTLLGSPSTESRRIRLADDRAHRSDDPLSAVPDSGDAQPPGWPGAWAADGPSRGPYGWTMSLAVAYHIPDFLGGSYTLGIPAAPHGFTDALDDAFHVELQVVGGAVFWSPGSVLAETLPATVASVGVRYQVRIFEQLSVFGAARGGVLWEQEPLNASRITGTGALVAGVLLHATGWVSGRVEVGYPGVSAGLMFHL